MTFTRCRERARLWSKVTTSGASNAETNKQINEAVDAFARRVNGLPYKEYLVLTPRFDLRTTFALHVSATDATLGDVDSDVVICAANADNQTSTQTATALQTAFQALGDACAGWTVAWSAYKFTVTIAATTTDLTIDGPTTVSYSDASELIFGGSLDYSDVEDSTSLVGSFPLGCNLIFDLGDATAKEVMRVGQVWWDNYRLKKRSWQDFRKGKAYGDPFEWAQRGDEILLYPTPNNQYEIFMEYKGVPADIDSVVEDTTTLPAEIPERYQEAIVHYVTYTLLLGDWDEDLADKHRKEFERIAGDYLVNYLSNNESARERNAGVGRLNYRVVSPSRT